MKTLATLFALLLITSLNAQWNPDTSANTLVADSESGDMKAEGTSDGKTYVVFWKSVPAPVNYELRLQVLDANGNQTLGPDGMLVSDQIPMGTFIVIWDIKVGEDDNLYIGVTGTGSDTPAHLFKMDTDGNHFWGSTSGLHIGYGYNVTLLPLSSGDVLVSWLDLSTNGAVMQKVDSNGNPIWSAQQPIELAGSDTAPADLYELSGDEFIVIFHEMLVGINSYLYAQRFDANGDRVWAAPVQLANGATAFNRKYKGIQDGNTVYLGYFSSPGSRFDSYLQRINPDGSLPWGINGSDFDVNQTDYEMETEIAFQSGSQYIWAVSTYRNGAQTERGEYVQKFDKNTGARELTDEAKEVFPIGGDKSHAGSLHIKNDSPLFLMEEGIDNGVSPTTLNVVYLNETGDFAWPEETRPVATFAADKSRVHFTKHVNGQNVAVFTEDKGDGMKIYAQNVEDDSIGIQDFLENSLFFANPVKDIMVLNSDSPIEAISIFNTLGQKIYDAEFNGKNLVNINTQNWNTGIYFMNVSTKETAETGVKLIKQ